MKTIALHAGAIALAISSLALAEPGAPFGIALSTDKLQVIGGGEAALTVSIVRESGFDRAIELSASDLPPGVVVAPVTAPQGTDSVRLVFKASAAHSLPTSARISAHAGNESRNATLTVTVRGLPGQIDTSFGKGGKIVTGVDAFEDHPNAMAVQPDGKVIVAGSAATVRGTQIALVRYQRDGALDASFGKGGKVLTAVHGRRDRANAVLLQPDGKILVAGQTQSTEGVDFALLRYEVNGRLDASFGKGGTVVVDFGSDADFAKALALQEDGRIIVGGHTTAPLTGVDFALARFHADGAPDESFGDRGKVVLPIRPQSARDSIEALALQQVDGTTRILAVGGEGDFIAARFREDGTLDKGFGKGGIVAGLFGSVMGTARAVIVAPDNKILLAGHAQHDFALARLTEQGAVDASFGQGGRVVVQVSADNWDEATAMVRQRDGKLILGGWVYAGRSSSADFALVRFHENGALDADFGDAGRTVTPVAPGLKSDSGRALILQEDERIPATRAIQAGEANDSNNDFALLRYWL